MTEVKEVKPAQKRGGRRPVAANPLEERRNKIAMMTKALVFKHTGQKPVGGSRSTMPHTSTGSVFVDFLIGGSTAKDGKGPICPGFPRRRITEVFGAESSGKTTLALQAIAKCQKQGGLAMFLDFEHALDHGYAETLGVSFDENQMIYLQPDNLEEGLQIIADGIGMGVDIIVVDSVAAMVPEAELDKKIGDNAKVGGLAKPLSENLPKFVMWLAKYPRDKETKKPLPDMPGTALVLLNQTRALIQTSGGGGPSAAADHNTSGGKALKFYSYVRLMLTRIGSEYIERKDKLTGKPKKVPFGNQTIVKCVKSKCDGKQGHAVEIFIRYGYGIDNYFSVIQAASSVGLMKKEGSWLSYGENRIQGRDKWRQYLIDNPKVFDELARKVNEAVLSTAETAISDDELTEEEQLLSEYQKEMGMDDELDTQVEEPKEIDVTGEAAEAV